MKHIYYIAILLAAGIFIGSCSEAKKDMFNWSENINFLIPEGDSSLIIRQDTVVYSFAFDPVSTERTISIPIEIVGNAASVDRSYKIKIENYGDTKAGIDYIMPNENQILPAGKMKDSLRIVFNRSEDMKVSAKKIGITIINGGDLGEGVAEKCFVAIQVSDILEKPQWWDHWSSYFGPYHWRKFQKWIEIRGGQGELPTGSYPGFWTTPQEISQVYQLRIYFEENPEYDENNIRLVVPCPV